MPKVEEKNLKNPPYFCKVFFRMVLGYSHCFIKEILSNNRDNFMILLKMKDGIKCKERKNLV